MNNWTDFNFKIKLLHSYMPGYPYNIDPNYGPVPMVSDDVKLSAPQPMIKEERLKENPSPNDNSKSQLQVIIDYILLYCVMIEIKI